jgi:hypothetical protein
LLIFVIGSSINPGLLQEWKEAARRCENIKVKDMPLAVADRGRAHVNKIPGAITNCCLCMDIFITPDGNIYGCACQTEYLGTVFSPYIPHDYLVYWMKRVCSSTLALRRLNNRLNNNSVASRIEMMVGNSFRETDLINALACR